MSSFLGDPFEHDVFVSYAHGETGHYGHWSQRLVEELVKDIRGSDPDKFGNVDVFIDTQLDPMKGLTEQLRNKVTSSGLLVIIMTRHYLRSSWCKDELTWFESQIKENARQGGLILVVHAQPTSHDRWPQILKDERGIGHLGVPFHPKPESQDDLVHPFGYPDPQLSDSVFFTNLLRLTTIITARLKDVRKNRALMTATQPKLIKPSDDGVFRVLLHPPRFAKARAAQMRDKFDAAVAAWEEAKAALETVACDVWPKEVNSEGVAVSDINRLRNERIDFLRTQGHAACMLRLEEDPLVDKVEALASDRSALLDEGLDIPLAVIDRAAATDVEDDLDEVEFFRTAQPGWALRFRQWLDGIHTQANPA